jgi:hypothetical protein
VVGLALCGLWALSDRVRRRSDDGKAEPRRSTAVWLALIIATGVLLVGVLGFVVVINREGAGSNGETSAAPRVTTTTVPKGPHLHPPQAVRIAIVNASGFARPGVDLGTKLRKGGFIVTGTTSAPVQEGSTIQCTDDFTIDASRLFLVMNAAAVVQPMAVPPPVDTTAVDCLIVLGR